MLRKDPRKENKLKKREKIGEISKENRGSIQDIQWPTNRSSRKRKQEKEQQLYNNNNNNKNNNFQD